MAEQQSGQQTMGRRERKKAATRKRISDVATGMFLERGFDAVSIREIADAADVSPTTVFAHFPQKEALVFDEEDVQRERLVAAVRDRGSGITIARALRDYLRADFEETVVLIGREAAGEGGPGGDVEQATRAFMDLVRRTPALAEFEARMWTRQEGALAAAIAEQLGLARPDDAIRVYSRFVLQVWQLMNQSADPVGMLDAAFGLLDSGWAAVEARHEAARRGATVQRL